MNKARRVHSLCQERPGSLDEECGLYPKNNGKL